MAYARLIRASNPVLAGVSFSIKDWSTLGVVITFAGTTIISVGLLLQKQAHRFSTLDEKPYFMHGSWLLASATYICGHILCWVGLGMAPQIVLALLNSWTMVSTVILANCFLREKLTLPTFLFVLWLAFGCSMVVYTGPSLNRGETLESVAKHALNPVVQCCLVVIPIIFLAVNSLQRQVVNKKVMTLSYTLIAATFAWLSALISKCTSSLTFTSLTSGGDVFMHWEYWSLYPLLMLFAGINIHYINISLSRDDATFIVPLYEITSITGQVILGGLFFDEFSLMASQQFLSFGVSLVFVVIGALGLSHEAHMVGELS